MKLKDILDPACVKVPLEVADKPQAIEGLVVSICEQADLSIQTELNEAVWERENTRTTGIGHGIAIPHGKAEEIDRLYMAIGRPVAPIEFGAIDKKPVDLIFLLASPVDQTGPHMEALAMISRKLIDTDFRNTLKSVDAGTLFEMITTE